MEVRQTSLFEEEIVDSPPARGLVLVARPDQPLTRAQQTFNRRIAKIEALRRKLDAQVRRLDKALAYYGEHLHPRLKRRTELRKDLVRTLAPFLDDKRLRRKWERATLKRIVVDHIEEIIADEGSLTDADLLAVFERIHGASFAQVEQQEMEAAFSTMETMFGEIGIEVDFSGISPDMSDEAFVARATEIAGKFQEQAKEQSHAFARRKRPRTKRQLESEERQRQAEQIRKRSIATIYKQLARVLHPDLEPDSALKDRKCALMQELTTAYHGNDLHTLLRLELEWIHHEELDLQRLTDEKLAIYNQVLKEQADELQREIRQLAYDPRYQSLVFPDGPFALRVRTDGPVVAASLDDEIASLKGSLARLRTGAAFDEVRDFVHTFYTPF